MKVEAIVNNIETLFEHYKITDEKDVLALRLAIKFLREQKSTDVKLIQCNIDCYRIDSPNCKYSGSRIHNLEETKRFKNELVPCPDYCCEDK